MYKDPGGSANSAVHPLAHRLCGSLEASVDISIAKQCIFPRNREKDLKWKI
jgi:hypothetical protein